MEDAAVRLKLVNIALAETPQHGSITFGLAELRPEDSASDVVNRADAALYDRQEWQRGPHGPQHSESERAPGE